MDYSYSSSSRRRRYHPYSTTSTARYIRIPSASRPTPVVFLPSTRQGIKSVVVQPNQSRLANLLTRYGQGSVKRVSKKLSASATKAKKARLNKLTKAQLVAKLC